MSERKYNVGDRVVIEESILCEFYEKSPYAGKRGTVIQEDVDSGGDHNHLVEIDAEEDLVYASPTWCKILCLESELCKEEPQA